MRRNPSSRRAARRWSPLATAALSLGQLGQAQPEVVAVSLGAFGATDQVMDALLGILLDGEAFAEVSVQRICADGLVALGQRSPHHGNEIAARLEQALTTPKLNQHSSDYIFDALWQLVVDTGSVA
jgi:hypothetical protein